MYLTTTYPPLIYGGKSNKKGKVVDGKLNSQACHNAKDDSLFRKKSCYTVIDVIPILNCLAGMLSSLHANI